MVESVGTQIGLRIGYGRSTCVAYTRRVSVCVPFIHTRARARNGCMNSSPVSGISGVAFAAYRDIGYRVIIDFQSRPISDDQRTWKTHIGPAS